MPLRTVCAARAWKWTEERGRGGKGYGPVLLHPCSIVFEGHNLEMELVEDPRAASNVKWMDGGPGHAPRQGGAGGGWEIRRNMIFLAMTWTDMQIMASSTEAIRQAGLDLVSLIHFHSYQCKRAGGAVC